MSLKVNISRWHPFPLSICSRLKFQPPSETWSGARIPNLRLNQIHCSAQHCANALFLINQEQILLNFSWNLSRSSGEKKNRVCVRLDPSYLPILHPPTSIPLCIPSHTHSIPPSLANVWASSECWPVFNPGAFLCFSLLWPQLNCNTLPVSDNALMSASGPPLHTYCRPAWSV